MSARRIRAPTSFRLAREWTWSFTGHTSNYFRPVMTFGFLLCYKLFGFAPFPFHLVSVLLNAAVVCVLFFVTLRMYRDRAVAFAAAALFALHPIHSESVAWIAAVTELQVAFFSLLTFWFFLNLREGQGLRRELTQLSMVVSFILALLSKEQALTLPALATVYEHFYSPDREQTTRSQKFVRYRVLWLLAIFYVPLRIHALRDFAPHSRGMPVYEILLSGIALAGQYLGKMFWPLRLNAFYVFDRSVSLLDWRVLAGIGALILCTVLFVVLWKQSRLASFGVVWFLVTLIPVLNAAWMADNVFTERYLYLPSVGFCWIVAFGLCRLWLAASSRGPVWRNALAGALVALAIVSAVRIILRNGDWRNDYVFFSRTLAASPRANPVRMNLALAYRDRGDLGAAERELREVLRSDSDNHKALNDLGGICIQEGRNVEAMTLLLRVIRLRPFDVGGHVNLGIVYMNLGLLEKAEVQFRAAVALAPMEGSGYLLLGTTEWRNGQHGPAEDTLKRGVAVNPYDSNLRLALAGIYEQTGRASEATREYESILRIDPGNQEAARLWQRLTTQRR